LRSMERAIAATGTLAAHEQSTLSAKVPGRLQLLAVDIGSVVRQGDLLAQVEPRDYELRLQQAAAALSQARAVLGLPLDAENDGIDLEQITAVREAKAVLDEAAKNRVRVNDLSRAGIASQSELDSVEATFAVARTRYETALQDARARHATLGQRRAEFEIAEKQLADASLRAPYDGVVQARPANVGEYVATGTPIVRLVKIDPLRLRLEVPERESLLVRAGQFVRLQIEGDTNIHTGRIARLSPAVDEQNRMLLVEADVPRQGALRPGLFARAQIVVSDGEESISVPANAVVSFAGIEKVVVVQEDKALERTVTTGRRGADWVEIISGVSAGETVVLEPGGLRTGQPLKIAVQPHPPQTANAQIDSGQ
jgi:RND family efflux transporter MFP subunit